MSHFLFFLVIAIFVVIGVTFFLVHFEHVRSQQRQLKQEKADLEAFEVR